MRELKLPRLVSDGMILQQGKKVRIWGEAEPERSITVSFLGEEYSVRADREGNWEVFLEGLKPGGACEMVIRDDIGNKKTISDILIGDVWMCSGQSNMELPMNRVKDKYPEEIENCSNDNIRTFKITEHGDFQGPLKELLTGEWKKAQSDTILDFSAAAYFFAKQLYQMTGVPVGLINASLGGSRIESWMSREMLEGHDDLLALADRYGDDEFVKGQLLQNQRQMEKWHRRLDEKDIGMKEHWESGKTDTTHWDDAEIPFFFKDTKLKGFIGSVWFQRSFWVSKELAGSRMKLWLGTIVDSDTVYINGTMAGHTDYQYPPRKYEVPAGLLKEGENVITIRVKCENGQGRFTPGKVFAIFNETGKIDLAGVWKYRVGAFMEQIPETDFVNWKPTGLYNGMTAPCHKYGIAGILWYQGEANTRNPESYLDLTKRLIEGYRKMWEDKDLPFLYVQLPNFSGDMYDLDRDGRDGDWPRLRELQRQALALPGTGMAVAIDVGENNDLHPQNKKDIGYRLAMQAASKLYGVKTACAGPQVAEIETEYEKEDCADNRHGCTVTLCCSQTADGMYAFSENKGKEINDFELMDEKGILHEAKAKLRENKIILTCDETVNKLTEIRYCYHNTNSGALIYNSEGFPMSPFCIPLK